MPRDVRLYAILARGSSQAVIFRRGPSRQVLLIGWDTQTDALSVGQWFKGRIYERRCDLSPDGEFLLYFAASYRKPYFSWTAVSKPPFFTALALWPKGDAWGGGGHFLRRSAIALNHRETDMALADGFKIPKWLTIGPFGEYSGRGEDDPIWSTRLARDGWTCVSEGKVAKKDKHAQVRFELDPPIRWERRNPRWPERYTLRMTVSGIGEQNGPMYVTEHDVVAASGAMRPLGRTEWAEWSHTGDLLFAKGGALFRVPCLRGKLASEPRLIADFTDATFTPREAPAEAQRWPKR